jgi:hypothetical protein
VPTFFAEAVTLMGDISTGTRTLERSATTHFIRGKELLLIDAPLDAGKAPADFFKRIIYDDFRARTAFLAIEGLYERYRTELSEGAA